MTTGPGLEGGTSRALLGLCAAALALVVWAVIVASKYAELPNDREYEALVPATLDGVLATDGDELHHLVRHHRPGETIEIHTGGRVERRTLVGELRGALFAFTLLEVLAFWAVCTFVLAPRARRPGIRDLFVSLLLAAAAIAIGGMTTPHDPGEQALSVTYLVCMAFMGPFFVRFSAAFPRPAEGERWMRRIAAALVAAGAVLAVWNVLAWRHEIEAEGVSGVGATDRPQALLLALLVVCLLLACFNLVQAGRRSRLARERRQARWILWGLAIGATPYVLLRLLPRIVLGHDPPWPASVDRVVEMTIPFTIAVAVVKERFLDIDVIIRRSVLYTLLAVLGAAVFFGVLAALLRGSLDTWTLWAGAIAGAVTGLLYRPARRRLGRWIDRTFFRVRHSHDRALAGLEGALAAATGQEEVVARLCEFLESTLAPKGAAAVLRADGEDVVCVRGHLGEADVRREARLPEGSDGDGRVLASPDATGVPEVETAAFPDGLARVGVRVVQPIVAGGRSLGLLLLGEKVTERHYLEEELSLLEAVAERAASALERMRLVQQVAEEAMARRTLAEVARQKADFFARLAHDLRTPITAVGWSVRNLLDGLPGPLTDRQREYLEGVGAATGQLARLVDNLVDLGRLDLQAPRRPSEPVDAAGVVREVAAALAPLARERRARIEVRVADALPSVRGRREAVFQIVVNLVDNALKYTAPDTAVEVTLRRAEDGSSEVELAVRDHGPGLPADVEALFALFAQGPESPHVQSRGFGIGLHIVRSWVEALGGTIRAENHPDGGAHFGVRLPSWEGEEETT